MNKNISILSISKFLSLIKLLTSQKLLIFDKINKPITSINEQTKHWNLPDGTEKCQQIADRQSVSSI